MDIEKMTMEEIETRMAAIETEINEEGADIEALSAETDKLIARKNQLVDQAAEKRSLLDKVANNRGAQIIDKPEEGQEGNNMDEKEIRNSKEYINAYANYIKTGDDSECRALLTTNVTGGQVPVPEYIEGRVRTAWQRLGLMDLVRKTYIRGNIKVGFELTATDAVVHTEGANAPTEEVLTLGVVRMVPASIKKWITISDEVVDMGGEEFLDYIYDEITYKIAKKAQENLLALIKAAPTTATASAVAVAEITGAPSTTIVAEAVANLSDEATNPVIVMNKLTYAAMKTAAAAAHFAQDPFEGLPVFFDNTIDAYSASGSGTWMIVGDFGIGAHANFPNGDEIVLKYDELSLAEKDLVKIVGREYVALGLVATKAFTRVVVGS